MKSHIAIICTAVMIFLLSCNPVWAQWDWQKVMVPETVDSDSFRVPNNMYLVGISFDAKLYSGMTSIKLMVAREPTALFDTLYYDSEVYEETLTDTSSHPITFKFTRTFAWEWFKVLFNTAPGDSIYIYPQFNEMNY